jgi:hypothetical protein
VGRWFGSNNFVIMSVRGTVHSSYHVTEAPLPWSWSSHTNPRILEDPEVLEKHGLPYGVIVADVGPNALRAIELNLGPLGFGTGFQSVLMPHWSLVVLSGALGMAPWLRWRFSLRTLIIGMTLVGVGLGLAIYALRN